MVYCDLMETYKPLRFVIGFNLDGIGGAKRLRDALQPYADFEEVRDELRILNRYIPPKRAKERGEHNVN